MGFTSVFYYFVTPFIAGIFAGLLFHIGLWWTVKALSSSRKPALLTIGSYYVRMGITLFIFYLVMNSSWVRLTVCLLGFLTVKYTMMRMLKPGENVSSFE
ncbi:F1/F0 ATPase, Methanosarcina type, subunit 2 [Candidatus Scalindua japonica]|uniref:F1/F0 ATPase, Methanosarcina type, subunit 2 n=1 Tax=Candidatus Scalindua japonica TaxID=1284222 RepID=A0A286U045_9BACT|nr:ATP synthase subunit I [Candidatus Scalindua japonica]GAX61515.1 F1/F0 ATPase, Methanosarcina type, subunit 2 [Candidatus Scalindua japonica]